ncbi:hypothetical protein L1049_018913 [Liquidambar formosana]|uniref:Protein kinase domain-containing protein n=1 Tax=Liquidambar formosana TaxID=63359 RepID=A0AAP0RAS1_LIQFO
MNQDSRRDEFESELDPQKVEIADGECECDDDGMPRRKGQKMYWACGIAQYAILCGTVIGYTITASVSMVAIQKSNCFHKRGHKANCKFSNNTYMIGLGIVEVFLSQIPNFHKLSWLSRIAAVMSFGYALIGTGLAFEMVVSGNGKRTSLTGVEVGPALTASEKARRMCSAFGNIAFAYSYAQVLIEIQDTLKSSPPEHKVMKKATIIGVLITTVFYMMCGCLGYAAFGNKAPGNMLTGFGFYEPFWLIDLANIFIVVHLVGAYQVNIRDFKVEYKIDLVDPARGGLWTTSAYIITTAIGSGVLSLAWGVAQLGWLGGVATLAVFAWITYYTSCLLADCYRWPDPVSGKRNHSYMEAVKVNLGGKMYVACGLVQYVNLSGMVIGYTITSSKSIVAIRRSNCFHRNGHAAPCSFSNNPYIIAVGILEIFLSQIPNFHKLSWLSRIAATMSFGYSSIGAGLALAKIISGEGGRTTLTGVEVGVDLSAAQKTWRVFRALGDMAFAYTYSQVFLEIQDTIKSSPQPENKVMKKANMIGVSTTTAFYMSCGCLGYAAFGNHAPGNMLTGFGFYDPFWLIDVANIFIVVHLVGAYQLGNPPSIQSWNSSSSPCDWPEIRCTNGTVTGILLRNKYITEKIPGIICDLKNLTELDLASNFLFGEFPQVLFNCSKLEKLDLSLSYLSDTIPVEIAVLSSLRYLNLSANNLHGNIPVTIGRLSKLKKLDLHDNRIIGLLPPEIGNLSNLQYLDISANDFSGSIPVSIAMLSNLKTLDLHENSFTGMLPLEIGDMWDLQYLDIGANNISGNIPAIIGHLSQLKTLYLHQNEFIGTIPPAIGNLSNLEVLDMAYNEKFGPATIPTSFGYLKKLRYLKIAASNLVGEIPEIIEYCSSLEQLDLSTNNLGGIIPKGLLLLKNLTNLYLFHNGLSGEIPMAVQALNLAHIDLSMNYLTGSIPKIFGKLQNLELLNLFSNQLSGEIPTSLGLIPALKEVRLFKNKLSGVLPPELGLHSKLQAFEVSENQLTGRIPGNLCAGGVLLGVLAFSNNLTGEVPRSLGNCTSLHKVELYSNRFFGDVPLGLWTCSNLSNLMLSDNSFSGELPNKLAGSLSRLELSNNMFSGKIPVELTSLQLLDTLLLDGNQLSGKLPLKIISWKSLTSLDLSRNNLSGQIPDAIGSLPSLRHLDLSKNQFSGEIPPQIGNLRFDSLNMSSNQLSGKIPNGFENWTYENSFLNNTNLCADKPILNLPSCSATHHSSDKLFPRNLATILGLVMLVFLVTLLLTTLIIGNYQRKMRARQVETWKLMPFQRLNFTETDILMGWRKNKILGSNVCGNVFYVSNIGHSGESFAVKRIRNNRNHKTEKEFVSEVEKLGKIRHSNIVRLLCCFSSENTKRIRNNRNHKTEKEFMAEIEKLGKIRHSNIVRLLCCISSENTKLLVYEFMERRSLDTWLHINNRESAHTIEVKEDVYGFGVVLLELVTGRKPNDEAEDMYLAKWAREYVEEGNSIVDALDEMIKEPCHLEEMRNIFELGLICISDVPSRRPSMKEVLMALIKISGGANFAPPHRCPAPPRSYETNFPSRPVSMRTVGISVVFIVRLSIRRGFF